jgi:hypothetical protein
MNEVQAAAPAKDQPHPFQPKPSVPAMAASPDSATGALATDPSCALCGSPRGSQIHLTGKSEAEQDSPNWG